VPKIRFDGVEHELAKRPLWGELDMIEHQSKRAFESMSSTLQTAASVLLTLRRAGVALTWDDVMAMSPDDFEWVDDPADDDPAEVDPPAAGAEAGDATTETTEAVSPPSPSSETATGS
jgi:hypothetical protein